MLGCRVALIWGKKLDSNIQKAGWGIEDPKGSKRHKKKLAEKFGAWGG